MDCFQILNNVTVVNNPGAGCGHTAMIIVNDAVAMAVSGYSMTPAGQLVRHWSESSEECEIFFRGQPLEEVISTETPATVYGQICEEDFGFEGYGETLTWRRKELT